MKPLPSPLSARPALRLVQVLDRGQHLRGIFMSPDGLALEDLSTIRPGALRRVPAPVYAAERARFMAGWAARNARRAAAGAAASLLILPMALQAAVEGFTPVAELPSVAAAELQADGSLKLVLSNGTAVMVPASSVSLGPDGAIAVADAVAGHVAELAGATAAGAGGGSDGVGVILAGVGATGALAGFAGGGGAGGDDVNPPPPSATGYAVDGYIAGGTVFRDLDGDGILDGDEPATLTSADGSFSFADLPGFGDLVVIGGIDISTGQAFQGMLTAPSDATVITPLTTLVQQLIASAEDGATPPTSTEAAETVAEALGLDGDILNEDPIADGDLAAVKAAAQVANIMMLAEAGGGDALAAAEAIAATLAEGTDPLASSDDLVEVFEATGLDSATATDLAQAAADANTLVAAADAVSAVEDVQTAVQTDLAGMVETGQPVADVDIAALVADIPPLTPVIDPLPATVNAAQAANGFVVSGTGRPGTAVTVTLGDEAQIVTVDVDGAWTANFAPADLPADGLALVRASAGPTSDEAWSSPVLFDTSHPAAPMIAVVAGDDVVSADQIETGLNISGTGTAGDTVIVTAGASSATATVASDGSWTVSFAAGDLPPDGPVTVIAVTQDIVGNSSGPAERDILIDTKVDPAPAATVVYDQPTVLADALTLSTFSGVLETQEADRFVTVSAYGNVTAEFTGSGFAYSGTGTLPVSAGQVTGIMIVIDGLPVVTLAELDIDAAELATAASNGDGVTFMALLGDHSFAVTGSAGDDELLGGTGDDEIAAGEGDDYILGSSGSDNIDGGAGRDQVAYQDQAGPLTADFVAGTIIKLDGTDTLTSVEDIRATAYDDSLTGSGADNSFRGLAGDDTIAGGGGTDTVRYDRDANYGGTHGVSVDLAAGTATDGFGDRDTLAGIENVRGTDFDDNIYGSADDNKLEGQAGSDFFRGSTGNDIIDGGAGFDQVVYRDAEEGVTVSLAEGYADKGAAGVDTLIGVEVVEGTLHDDALTGDHEGNSLHGLAGNDVMDGGAGVDELRYDREAQFGGNQGVTVDLAAGTATDSFGDTDTILNIEAVRGTSFADSFLGSADDNSFRGLAGDDTIVGGGGRDTVAYDQEFEEGGAQGVRVDLAASTAVDSFGDTDTLTGIQNVTGSQFDDDLRGDDGDNLLVGGFGEDEFGAGDVGGNDTLVGRGGHDTLDGGLGDDIFDGGTGQDTIIFGEGEDTVYLYLDADDSDLIHDFTAGTPGDGTADTIRIVVPDGAPPQDVDLNVITATVTDFAQGSIEAAYDLAELTGDVNLLLVSNGTDSALYSLDTGGAPGDVELTAVARFDGLAGQDALDQVNIEIAARPDWDETPSLPNV